MPSEPSVSTASKRRSSSLSRENIPFFQAPSPLHEDSRRGMTQRSTSVRSVSRGHPPPPGRRSSSVQGRRASGSRPQRQLHSRTLSSREASRERYEKYSKSSPSLGSRDRYNQGKQPQQQYDHIYHINSNGSAELNHPSHGSLLSSRGDSSDAGSVHSAPSHHQYASSHKHRVVIVEHREPTSTKKISFYRDMPSPNTHNKGGLPLNHKQLAKAAKRVIDDLKKAADPSCPQDRRIVAITNACAEFDHVDEAKHNVELQQGAATALCKVLAAVPPHRNLDGSSKGGDVSSTISGGDVDDEVRMIAAAMEMIFRGQPSYIQEAVDKCSLQLLPLLLTYLERAETGTMKHAEVSILNISKVLLYWSRVSELRVPMARHPGMLSALARVGTSALNPEARIVRARIIANLVNASDDNKRLMLAHEGLLDALLKTAHLDTHDQAREYAGIALMDLANASCNQVAMAKNEKILGTLVKMVLMEEVAGTRESAITALQNLAYKKDIRIELVTFKDGIVLECLKKTLSSDTHDKSRRRAGGCLTNLACDETADVMGNHKGLLETLALVSTKDESSDVQNRASMALTKLAASITVHMSSFPILLDALVVGSLSPMANSVSAVLRVKARDPENRLAMAQHKGILDTLADTCTNNAKASLSASWSKRNLDAVKDRDNAMRAIMHLTNESKNRKTMCTKPILTALVEGANISDDDILNNKQLEEIRDSAIRAIERLATETSIRSIMARHDGLLVAIAKATEREAKLEVSMGGRYTTAPGTPGGDSTTEHHHAFLAKPLLMSLLVAM